MKVSWQNLKQFLDDRGITANYVELDDKYWIKAYDNNFSLECDLYKNPSDTTDLDDFEDNYKPLANKPLITKTQTRFEREDVRDQMSRATAAFVDGEAEILLQIPGTPGSGDGRYIGGGYATLDSFHPGDACVSIDVVDVDNLLEMGANTVIASYHDTGMDEANQGWYAWAGNSNTGEIEVEPMGYYGFIPSGMYLRLIFVKHASSTAANVYVDFWMGKQIS